MAEHRQAGSLWTPEEDVVLLRHVAKYGTKHWGYLQSSGVLPHRDQKACCNRFILLKRKFFQARAKGQRLTFPVVPQPEPLRNSQPAGVTSTSSAPLPSAFAACGHTAPLQSTLEPPSSHLRRTTDGGGTNFSPPPPSGLHMDSSGAAEQMLHGVSCHESGRGCQDPILRTVSSGVSFKRPGGNSGALSNLGKAVLMSAMQDFKDFSAASDVDNVSAGFQGENTSMFQRTVDNLPEVNDVVHAALSKQPSTETLQLAPVVHVHTTTAVPTNNGEQSKYTPALRLPLVVEKLGGDAVAPVHALQEVKVKNPLGSGCMHTLAEVRLQPKASPSAADSLLQAQHWSPGDSAANALPSPASAQAAVWRCFNPSAFDMIAPEVSGDLGFPLASAIPAPQNISALAPDALLDQIAASPLKMLFGVTAPPAPSQNYADLSSCADGAAWHSPAASCFDLWDIMHTPATV